ADRLSVADAVRPEDHLAARRHDAFPHHAAVIPVVVAGSHSEPERADLNAGAAGVRAEIDLSGGRNCRDERSRRRDRKDKFPHGVLLSHTLPTRQRMNGIGVAALKKYLTRWNPRFLGTSSRRVIP